ncbi:hypothetical protein ACQB60_40635 [Actinomycetota bacterium Odt1-20B]
MAATLTASSALFSGVATAQAAPGADQPANWNVEQNSDKYDAVGELARSHTIVALQEAPNNLPDASFRTDPHSTGPVTESL